MIPPNRFLFLADFLGTTKAYPDIEQIRIQRNVLERAVQSLFLKRLDELDLYVYIASDSLFVCCPSLEHILSQAARLFDFYHSNVPNQPRLRGAISYGKRAESAVLAITRRVITIPLLDDSLPRVLNLEKIRKGSRIFLDPNIPQEAIAQHEPHMLHWRSITGYGDREASENVTEFLWPRAIYNHPEELLRGAKKITSEWSQQLQTKEWPEHEYNNGIMIQLDETVKMFIRSLAPFYEHAEVRSYLCSLLPHRNHKGQAVFEWGFWFQALKALIGPNHTLTDELRNQIEITREVLLRERRLADFLAELLEDDYADFKPCVWDLLQY